MEDDGYDYLFLQVSSQLMTEPTVQDKKQDVDLKSIVSKAGVSDKLLQCEASEVDSIFSQKLSAVIPQHNLPKIIYQEGACFDTVENFNKKILKEASIHMTPFIDDNTTHYIVDLDANRNVLKGHRYYKAIGRGLWILHPAWIATIKDTKYIAEEEEYELIKYYPTMMTPHFARIYKKRVLEGITIIKIIEITVSNFKFREDDLEEICILNGAQFKRKSKESMKETLQMSTLSAEEKEINGQRMFILASNLGTNTNFCQRIFATLGCLTIDPSAVIRLIDENNIHNLAIRASESFLSTAFVKAKNKRLLTADEEGVFSMKRIMLG